MSMRELEAGILSELKRVAGNSKLRLKDMMEWSTGEVKAHEGETRLFLPSNRVFVCVKSELVKAEPPAPGAKGE